MRRNLLVKGEGTLLGRKTSLCQDTKHPAVFKYCIQGCQGRCHVESKGKESAQKMKRQSTKDEETVGKGAALGRLRVTLIPALSHCLSASP